MIPNENYQITRMFGPKSLPYITWNDERRLLICFIISVLHHMGPNENYLINVPWSPRRFEFNQQLRFIHTSYNQVNSSFIHSFINPHLLTLKNDPFLVSLLFSWDKLIVLKFFFHVEQNPSGRDSHGFLGDHHM